MKRRRTKLIGKQNIQVGDFVLIGTYATLPGHWWLGEVLWIGKEDLLVEQYGTSGQHVHRAVQLLSEIRAAGTAEELFGIKDRCREEVKALADAVHAAESALGAARDAVWRKVDEFWKAELTRNTGAGI
ncbi:MAG: hypothetical protein INR68_18935 [Methylobacterium mesophilicum]|nr:hypothetical protein [Methylobacterium mesophilicum]